MARRYVFSCFFIAQVYSLVCTVDGLAQSTPEKSLRPGYYVVIAAYRLNGCGYAQQYVQKLSDQGITAATGLDAERGYLYVYLRYHTDRGHSLAAMYRIRSTTHFKRAWVRIMGRTMAHDKHVATSGDAKSQFKKESAVGIVQQKGKRPEGSKEAQQLPFDGDTTEFDDEKSWSSFPATKPMRLPDTVLVRLYQKENHRELKGEVVVFDADRSCRLGVLLSSTRTTLPDPANNSGMLMLEVSVFGYEPQQVYVPFILTLADTLKPFVSRSRNVYVITFYLERYKRGELYAMNHVYFYNNAAIMLPGSVHTLNKLLEMMQEYPSCVIRLHGHTNGRVAGKLITMGERNNFFALSDDVRESFSSARKLSRERALTIKKWLSEHGIASKRIKTKAWGGTKMIYDQHRSNAYRNVRVEVEILKQ